MAGQRTDTQVDNCTKTSKETRDLQIDADSKASLLGNLSGSQAPCQACNIPCTKTSGTGNPASLATCQDVLDRTEAGAAGSQPDNCVQLCQDHVKGCMEIRGTESTPQSQGTCHDTASCDMQARGICKASCQEEAPSIPLMEPTDPQDDEALPDNWLSDLEVFIGLADSEDLQTDVVQTDVAQTELTESIEHGTTDRDKQKVNEIVKENIGASQQDAGAAPAGGKAAIASTAIPKNATTICPAGRSCTRSLISLNGTHPPAESRAPVSNSVCMERRSQARREAQDLRLRLLNLGNALPERAKMPICPMSPIRADLKVPLDASAPLAVTSCCPMAFSALDTSMNADQICKSCNQTKVNLSTLGRGAEKINVKIRHHRRQERHSATPSVRSSLQLQSDSGGSIDIGLNGEDAFELHRLPMPLMRFSPTLQLAYQMQDPSDMKADNTRMPQFKHSSKSSDRLGNDHFEALCFDLHGNLVDGYQPGTVRSENRMWSDLVATCAPANPCHPSVQHGASEEGQLAPSHEVAGNREAPVVADNLSVPPEPEEVLSVSGPVPASGQMSDGHLRQTGIHAAYTHCSQAMGVEGSHEACDTLSVETDQMVSHTLRGIAGIQPVTDVQQNQTRDANCVQTTTIPPEAAGGQNAAIVAVSSSILQEKSGTASRVAVVGQNKPLSWPTENGKNASIVPINTSILHDASWVASMEGENAAKSYMGTGIALDGNTVSAGAEVVHETIATFSVRSETATEAKILGAVSPAAVGDVTNTTHAAGRGVRVAETCKTAGDASYGEANNAQPEEEMQPQKAHGKTPPRSAATNTLDSAQTCTPDLYLLDSAPPYTSASFCRELHSGIFRCSGLHVEDMLPSPDGMDTTDIRAMMHQIMATPSCSSFCQISSAEKDPETHDDPPLYEALRVACFRTGLPCHAWATSSCSLSSIVHDRVLKQPDSIASQNEFFGLLSPLLHPLSEALPYASQSSQPAAGTQGKTGIGSPFSPLLDAHKVSRSSPHPPAASLLFTACQDANAVLCLDGGVQKAAMNQLPADTVVPHFHCQFDFKNAKRDAEILAQVWGSCNEPQWPTKIEEKPRRHQAHHVCAADGSSGRNKHSDGALKRKKRFRQNRCTDSSTDEAGDWQCNENEYYVLPPTLTRAERLSKRQAATCKVKDSPDSRITSANQKRRDPTPKKCVDRSNWSPRPPFENMTDRDLTTKEPLAAWLLHQQTDEAEDSLKAAKTAKTEDVTGKKPSLATIEATNMSNPHKGQLPADGAQAGMVSSVPWLTAIKHGPVSFDKEKFIRHNVKNVSTLKDRNGKQELEPPEVDPAQHAYAPSASPQRDRVGQPALDACEMDPPAHAVTPSSPTLRDGKGRQWKCSNCKMGLVSMDTTATMLKECHGNQVANEGIERANEFCTSTRTDRHLRQQSVVCKATHSLVRAQDDADKIWIDGQTKSRSKPTSECNLCTRAWQRLDGVMESAGHELLLPVLPCRSRELLALSRAKQSAQPSVQAAPERKGQKRRRPKERACMIKCPCVRSDLNGKCIRGGENCGRFLNSGIC
jgi:hypothetical protein